YTASTTLPCTTSPESRMRTRWSTAMRSGVPVGNVKGIVAGVGGSTARPSSEEGGAHSEAPASSRGVSAQPEISRAAGGALGALSGSDWASAEAQTNNDTGRHLEIRARYIVFYLDVLAWGQVPAFVVRNQRLDIRAA